jgi:hypothetical protein
LLQDIAPLAVVQWAAWDVQAGADPEKLQLTEFIAPGINPHAAAWNSGPYSRTILVPAWGAIVVAHRKASDDHIRLYGAPFFYLDFYLQMAHKLASAHLHQVLCMQYLFYHSPLHALKSRMSLKSAGHTLS